MTLRFRLTLWYTILLALMLLTFALVFHGVLARTLYNQVDDTIRSQAEQIVNIFEKNIDPAAAKLPTAIVLSSQVFAQATSPRATSSTRRLTWVKRLPWPDTSRKEPQGEIGFYSWQDSQTPCGSTARLCARRTGDRGGGASGSIVDPIKSVLQTFAWRC